jgi:ribonuclease HI
MLLSIDRVLQLLSEGKSIEKISELANCSPVDVIGVINSAREFINSRERKYARKKIIIGKKRENEIFVNENSVDNSNNIRDLLKGAELHAVPLESYLVIYTKGKRSRETGYAGIGIVIYDKENRQVGKVSINIGKQDEKIAEYTAIIKALKIAEYFRAQETSIRTDSEIIIKQLNGEYKVTSDLLREMLEKVNTLKSGLKNCRFEQVKGNLNEKANYVADRAAQKPI